MVTLLQQWSDDLIKLEILFKTYRMRGAFQSNLNSFFYRQVSRFLFLFWNPSRAGEGRTDGLLLLLLLLWSPFAGRYLIIREWPRHVPLLLLLLLLITNINKWWRNCCGYSPAWKIIWWLQGRAFRVFPPFLLLSLLTSIYLLQSTCIGRLCVCCVEMRAIWHHLLGQSLRWMGH